MYSWKEALKKIMSQFTLQLTKAEEPEQLRNLVKDTVDEFTTLLKTTEAIINFENKPEKIREVMDFLRKSVVVLNDTLPYSYTKRVAVQIPLSPIPCINLCFIPARYWKKGRLPFIGSDDIGDTSLTECIASIPLARMH